MTISKTEATRGGVREAKNTAWDLDHVRGQYSYTNSHSDLYLYLSRWMPVEEYLNIGYTDPRQGSDVITNLLYLIDILGVKRPGQVHLHADSQLRLVDLMAEKLAKLHECSEYADDNVLLDIGSGRGGPAIHAFRKYGLNVLGIDITPFNVHKANRNAANLGIDSDVRFCAGDALSLPLPDASFTIAWSIESPAHFSDKPRFLQEMGRVVKSGGVVAVADLLLNDAVPMVSFENKQAYERFLQTWDVPYLETFDSYKRAFDEAGFEICESTVITQNNLGIFHKYGELFLGLSRIRPMYHIYKNYLRMRTGANLDNVYDHIYASCLALRARMIDYGLFWAVRR